MYPLVCEVNLYAVDVVNLLVLVLLFDCGKDSVNIHLWSQVDTVLRDEILGICSLQFSRLHLGLCKVSQEQCNADQSVTSVVNLRIDDTSVTFTTDYCVCVLHLCDNIDLANSGGIVLATSLASHVTNRTSGAQVRDCVSLCMAQHIVGNTYKRVLLAEHLSVLADDGKTVNIRINYETDINLLLLAKTAEGGSKELQDSDIIKLIQKLAKQRKEAAEQYVAAGRQELADNELAEAEVLATYLPKMLSEEEVEAKLKEIIASVGASGPQDMGKVMGVATKALAGLAEGRTISTIVRKLLA